MITVLPELVSLSDQAWRRLRDRLDGLTDDENLWEPAPGCWTIRPRRDGTWTADGTLPRPDPEPFTTIAWRLWHLIDMYGEDRAPRWLDVEPQGPPIGPEDPEADPPATAAVALDLLDRAHDRWDAHLALVSEDRLAAPVGPLGGAYAERTVAAYVLHMLDEFIHHGAEVAVLRDLWRWRAPLADDPRLDGAMRGDRSLCGGLGADDPEAATVLEVAAAYGRWDLVTGLVDAGTPLAATGRTPLHLAAGAGELAVVGHLVAHGADTTARDPEFHATPAQWARFLGHDAVVGWLDAHAPG